MAAAAADRRRFYAVSLARLQLETAKKALKFYRLREQTNKPPATAPPDQRLGFT
jgi:hypothetical protein